MRGVTVVIPVLDDAPMLEECLAALDSQTRPPDLVVVVDNGSVDDSALIAKRAGAMVVHESRRGILNATATGFDAAFVATPDNVLARIDADSRPRPDWLAKVATHFDADPELAGLTGPGEFYGARGERAHAAGRRLYLGGYFLWLGLLLGHPPLYGSNFALRADVWPAVRDRVHLDRNRVHDDLDISFQLPPQARVTYDPDLGMPVSDRPFASVRATARRVAWGFATIWFNAREQNLLQRRRRVLDRSHRHGDP